MNIPLTYTSMGTPRKIVMLPNNSYWYVDSQNSRLVKVSAAGSVLRTVGRLGWSEGEFSSPLSMTRDSSGYLYVLDLWGNVYKLDANGGFISETFLAGIPPKYNQATCYPTDITFDAKTNTFLITNDGTSRVYRYAHDLTLLSSFVSGGADLGELKTRGITTDSNGNIYVADPVGNVVRSFTSAYQARFTLSTWVDGDGNPGALNNPADIVILSNGNIVVSSKDGHSIVEFSSTGAYITSWGNSGDGKLPGSLIGPEFVTRDIFNNIYVSDSTTNNIKKFSSSGSFISSFGNNQFSQGKFWQPSDLTYDSIGNLYVLDNGVDGGGRVQEFSNSGTYITTILSDLPAGSYFLHFINDNTLLISNTTRVNVYLKTGGVWTYSRDFGEENNFDFYTAQGIAHNSQGHIYVADFTREYIYILDSNYQYLGSIGDGVTSLDDLSDSHLVGPLDIYIDNQDRIFVTCSQVVKEFAADGSFIKNVTFPSTGQNGYGDVTSPQRVTGDALGNIYIADNGWDKIITFNASGTPIDQYGGQGSGDGQFNAPTAVVFNPVNHLLTVLDGGNSRIQMIAAGVRALNLIPSANIIRLDAGHVGESLSEKYWDPNAEDLSNIPARLMFGDYVVADFNIDLSVDRNWQDVNAITLPDSSTSLVVNLNTTSAPGISATHSLYIARYSNQTSVTVCPDATLISDVQTGCTNARVLVNGVDSDLSIVTINGQNYWKIDGLSGTGAFSSLFQTTFGLKDTLTREKVYTLSNHELTFGTTYDITHTGDTITIGFSSDWDLSTVQISDLALNNGTIDLNLGVSDGVDTWGVSIDNIAHQILLIAPTNSGSSQYIGQGSHITLFINNDTLRNPALVGSYKISLFLLTSDGAGGHNSESGSVSVPIVDSDQVNVTSYVNTYISFDIDTAVGDLECDYNTCMPYGDTGTAADNYTVDLGELNSGRVNISNGAIVKHSDGLDGVINSIYLDLTSNAWNGAVVSVSSANSGLQGPPGNLIASVASNGAAILANSGSYGFTLPLAGSGNGTLARNSSCQVGTAFCQLILSGTTVFNTDGMPLDGGRVRMDVAAAPSYVDNPGSYSDTLTFIAVATF